MSTNLSAADRAPEVQAPVSRRFSMPDFPTVARFLTVIGFGWLVPIMKMAAGEDPKAHLNDLWRQLGVPILAILTFLFAWAQLAPTVQTSLGAIPGPAQVWEQVEVLAADHVRQRDKADAFYERQEERNAKLEAEGKADKIKWRDYTGKPTYLDQIITSLKTV